MAFFDKLRDFGEGVASGLSSGSGFETGLALGARAQEGRRSDRRLQMQEDEKTRNRLLSLFRSSPQAAIAQAESKGEPIWSRSLIDCREVRLRRRFLRLLVVI